MSQRLLAGSETRLTPPGPARIRTSGGGGARSSGWGRGLHPHGRFTSSIIKQAATAIVGLPRPSAQLLPYHLGLACLQHFRHDPGRFKAPPWYGSLWGLLGDAKTLLNPVPRNKGKFG